MKFYSSMENEMMVITKNETPYDMNGNKGVTYRLVIMGADDVEKLKCINKDVYDSFVPGNAYMLTGEFDVRNGKAGEWKVNGYKTKK